MLVTSPLALASKLWFKQVSPESLSQSRSCAWPSGLIFENHSSHIYAAKIYLQKADEKLRKDGIIKLPHWKHDSTFSDRKPRMPSRGDLRLSPSGPDAKAQHLSTKVWVKNPGGGQERSSLGPSSGQFFPIIRTGYEVSLENSVTTPYTINSINLGKISLDNHFEVSSKEKLRAVALWEQNPKDHANTRSNKKAQDPGPPKALPTRKSQRPISAWRGSSVRAIPIRRQKREHLKQKITGWGFKKETGSTEHTEEGLQSRFSFSRNNHVPIGERTLSHSQYELTSSDTW